MIFDEKSSHLLLFDLTPGDVCMLCSDGFYNGLSSKDQLTQFVDIDLDQASLEKLIQEASQRDGSDNLSFVIVKAQAE